MVAEYGKGYNETYFDKFATKSGQLSFFDVRLYGTDGTSLVAVAVKNNGELGVDDSYTLGYDGSNQLTSVTRASDSKVLTLTWVAGNLTAVSDWA